MPNDIAHFAIHADDCQRAAVEDVAATAAAIEAHGGQVTMEPFEIEQVGTLVMFRDTEGNTVGAMQYLAGVR